MSFDDIFKVYTPQLPTFNFQLSTFNFQLSTFNFQLSTFKTVNRVKQRKFEELKL